MRDFLNMSTPTSVAITILCVLIENKFPEAFKGNATNRKIRISVDLSDWRHSLFLFVVVGVVLFTPGLNLAISILYSFFIIYQIIKYTRK